VHPCGGEIDTLGFDHEASRATMELHGAGAHLVVALLRLHAPAPSSFRCGKLLVRFSAAFQRTLLVRTADGVNLL